jgi:hypothetical protein
MMTADSSCFLCITEVPSSISELKELESLHLSGTRITGTVDFDHHPTMITDFCCAFQTSVELKDASI